MNQKRDKRPRTFLYEVIDERTTKSRTYQLVRFSLSKGSTKIRKRIMEKILDESGAIGLVEWWLRGSIVQKPKWEFYGILVLERPDGS